MIILSWERNLLALHDLGDVQIEEIAVENGLFVGGVKISKILKFLKINRQVPEQRRRRWQSNRDDSHSDSGKSNWRCTTRGNCPGRTSSAR